MRIKAFILAKITMTPHYIVRVGDIHVKIIDPYYPWTTFDKIRYWIRFHLVFKRRGFKVDNKLRDLK